MLIIYELLQEKDPLDAITWEMPSHSPNLLWMNVGVNLFINQRKSIYAPK